MGLRRLLDRFLTRPVREVEGTVALAHPVHLTTRRVVWLLRLREHGGAFWVDPSAGEPPRRPGTRVRVVFRSDGRRPPRRHVLQVERAAESSAPVTARSPVGHPGVIARP